METRAKHLTVGLFVLVVLLSIAGFCLWAANVEKKDDYTKYFVRFSGSVAQLRVDSSVLFGGIPVGRVRFLTYLLSGTLGGLNGALLAGYFRGANVDIGNEYLLASIAVVVIGGTSVAGGRANVPGLWGASLFLVLLLTMLNTFGVSAGVRLVVTGLVIIGVIIAAGGEKATR